MRDANFVKNQRKSVLITGGSRGIGRACALLMAGAGYNVAIGYRHSRVQAAALVEELRRQGLTAHAFDADVSDPAEVEAMLSAVRQRFGSIDILVANAGIAGQSLLTDITDREWNAMISTNLSGVFYCCRGAARDMIANHWGRIITISSMWGIRGASCEIPYSTAKAGIIGMTKAISKELGLSGITANCIAPGVIDTDMCGDFDQATMDELAAQTPAGRIGTPQDVAAAVLFLASEEASFITGQALGVDGGFL